jgi:hypothetical protein
MLQYKNLTRAETLAVMIVAVLGGGTVAGEMIAVTALARFLSPTKEALLRARIRTWERLIESLVIYVENNTATLYYFLRCDVDVLRASSLAHSGPSATSTGIGGNR